MNLNDAWLILEYCLKSAWILLRCKKNDLYHSLYQLLVQVLEWCWNSFKIKKIILFWGWGYLLFMLHYISHWSRCWNDAVIGNSFEIKKNNFILRMDISFIHYLSHWSRCCNDAVIVLKKKIILRMDSSIIGQYQSLIQVILVRNKFVTMK